MKRTWIRAYMKRRRYFLKRMAPLSPKDKLKKATIAIINFFQKQILNATKPKTSRYYREKQRIIKRLQKLANNGGAHTQLEWQNLLEITSHTCQGCGRSDIKLYKDHIKPVAKGGTDFISNIQPLCLHCNFLKAAKFPFHFEKSE